VAATACKYFQGRQVEITSNEGNTHSNYLCLKVTPLAPRELFGIIGGSWSGADGYIVGCRWQFVSYATS